MGVHPSSSCVLSHSSSSQNVQEMLQISMQPLMQRQSISTEGAQQWTFIPVASVC